MPTRVFVQVWKRTLRSSLHHRCRLASPSQTSRRINDSVWVGWHFLETSSQSMAFCTVEDQAVTPQATQTFEYTVEIDADDIDHMGHVNHAVYLKWVQAAVLRHWERVAPTEAIAKYLWVALKHEISYRSPAFLTDHVVATVVLERIFGARAFYKAIIRRGEEVLAEIKSCWCCLDSVTKKPARIDREIVARFLPSEGPPMPLTGRSEADDTVHAREMIVPCQQPDSQHRQDRKG